MEGKVGLTEILFIVAIALLLFGPSKFAALGKGLGEGIRNFKASMNPKDEPKKEEEEKKS
ncbi:MAG TPA: twin-arginine translocase TatA/TatE family subunit [Candidatus Sulfotelmatobacter sp.]|nr:twin-arginine translocase TatA/TatE family subunit [Candidatus Sulfotelmatobacter sp.]